MLFQAMEQLSMQEPTEAFWYVFGRMAEQYGENAIAVQDYKKLMKPKREKEVVISSKCHLKEEWPNAGTSLVRLLVDRRMGEE